MRLMKLCLKTFGDGERKRQPHLNGIVLSGTISLTRKPGPWLAVTVPQRRVGIVSKHSGWDRVDQLAQAEQALFEASGSTLCIRIAKQPITVRTQVQILEEGIVGDVRSNIRLWLVGFVLFCNRILFE